MKVRGRGRGRRTLSCRAGLLCGFSDLPRNGRGDVEVFDLAYKFRFKKLQM